jgi:hypothetical protein
MDVPTTPILITPAARWMFLPAAGTLRFSCDPGALEMAAPGGKGDGLTRIRSVGYRMRRIREAAHVRDKTMCAGTLCSRPRASPIADPRPPINGADLAAAACQVHRDSWTWQWRRFRHPPPRRPVE